MQKRYFKSVDGKTIDVVDFCREKCVHGTTLYVGTDSVALRDRTLFVTVVAVRFGSVKDKTANGASFVYLKQYVPKHKDKLLRLRDEAVVTMDIVSFLEENFIPVDVVEFDYNSNPEHDSNKVIDQIGWAKGLGYAVTVKPDEQVAVKAADHICRS